MSGKSDPTEDGNTLLLRPPLERLQPGPGGGLQVMASEEAGAAAQGEAAGGVQEAGGGQWVPVTQP